MVAPNDEANNTDSCHSEHHGLVTKDGTTCARCQHFGNNSERWNYNNIHFRMPEEPEQMLEQERIAACRKEHGSKCVVKEKESHADDERWKGHVEHENAHEDRPSKQWHLHECHARSAHCEHGGDEVHTTQRRRCTEHQNPGNKRRCTWIRTVLSEFSPKVGFGQRRVRRVHDPRNVGTFARPDTSVDQRA